MPTVLLVRHGQASFGASDYDVLSPLGQRQSALVAESLAQRGYQPSRIVTGGLRRQIDTAAALAGPAPAVDGRWDEYDSDSVLSHHSEATVRLDGNGAGVGSLSSREFQAILEPALLAWIETADRSPATQSWPRFSGDAAAALADLAAALGRGETAVVVTSGGVIAALVGSLLGAPAAAFAALNRVIVNTGVTKLAIGASGTTLISFNDHSHLEAVDRELVTYR